MKKPALLLLLSLLLLSGCGEEPITQVYYPKTSSVHSVAVSAVIVSEVSSAATVSETSSAVADEAEEAKEKQLREKEEEKASITARYQEAERILTEKISAAEELVATCETAYQVSTEYLDRLNKSLEKLLLLPYDSSGEEELKQEIQKEEGKSALLWKEYEEAVAALEQLETELSALQKQYDQELLRIAEEILKIS